MAGESVRSYNQPRRVYKLQVNSLASSVSSGPCNPSLTHFSIVTCVVRCVNITCAFAISKHIVHPIRGRSYPCTGLDKPIGFQEVEAFRISRQSAHEGGKFVSPKHRSPLPTRGDSGYSFPHRGWKISIYITTSGIEPVAFRLVAQCLNQRRYRVPRS